LTERKTTSNTTVIIGIVGLIVMLLVFEAIRELWQKGTSPLRGNPLGYVIFVVVFVGVLALGYFIHKRYKT
jgi:Na+/proline symporter